MHSCQLLYYFSYNDTYISETQTAKHIIHFLYFHTCAYNHYTLTQKNAMRNSRTDGCRRTDALTRVYFIGNFLLLKYFLGMPSNHTLYSVKSFLSAYYKVGRGLHVTNKCHLVCSDVRSVRRATGRSSCT